MDAKALKVLSKIPDFLWLYTLVAMALGLTYPATFKQLAPAITPLLGSVILAMGLTLRGSDFMNVFKNPKKALVGILSQYTVMPLGGFIVAVALLGAVPEFIAGQVLTGTCPTGVVSNVYTYLSMGNVALSITLSAINTVIAPILTPTLTGVLAGKFVPVDVWALFLDMVQVTLIPVTIGVVINTVASKYVAKIKPILPAYSSFAVATIVAYVAASGQARILTLTPFMILLLIVATLIHLFLGYALGYAYGKAFKLDLPDRITISTETAMQNSGLATVLAIKHWDALAALPAVTYSIVQNVLGPFICQFFRKRVVKTTQQAKGGKT